MSTSYMQAWHNVEKLENEKDFFNLLIMIKKMDKYIVTGYLSCTITTHTVCLSLNVPVKRNQ